MLFLPCPHSKGPALTLGAEVGSAASAMYFFVFRQLNSDRGRCLSLLAWCLTLLALGVHPFLCADVRACRVSVSAHGPGCWVFFPQDFSKDL